MKLLKRVLYPKAGESLILSTIALPLYEHITAYHQGYISSRLKNGLYTTGEILFPALKGAGYGYLTIKALEVLDYIAPSSKTKAVICAGAAVANTAVNIFSYFAGKERVIHQKMPKHARANVLYYSEHTKQDNKNSNSLESELFK